MPLVHPGRERVRADIRTMRSVIDAVRQLIGADPGGQADVASARVLLLSLAT
jgi:hypothetical protein